MQTKVAKVCNPSHMRYFSIPIGKIHIWKYGSLGKKNSFVIEMLICGDLFRWCVDMAVLHIYGTIVGRLNQFYQLNNSAVLMNKNYLLLLDL